MNEPSWSGDPEALLAHARWVRSLARSLVLDPNRADDVEQQVWLGALRKPPAHARNLSAWLARVVHNAARELGRRESRRASRERATPAGQDAPSTEELVEQAEVQREVVSAVLELEEPYRMTILLRYWRDLSPQAIARMQGEPAGTVRSRLHRAHERLREQLDRRFHGDRHAWSSVLFAWIHAGETAKVAGVSALVAGGIAMGWKLAAGLIVVVGALVAWWAWPDAPPPPQPEEAPVAHAPEPAVPADPPPAAPSEAVLQAPVEDPPRERQPVTIDPPPTIDRSSPAIRGRVTDLDESPIENATVKLFPDVLGSSDPEPLTECATDEQGRYRVTLPEASLGRFALTAEAPGYRRGKIEGVDPDRVVDLTLCWLVDLVGQVRDAETGEPLADATILWRPDRKTTTDTSGTYRASGIVAGQTNFLYARKEGYAQKATRIELNRPEEATLDLELSRGVPLVVEVFDRETDSPVAGADVCAQLHPEPLTRTGEDGRCEIRIADGDELWLKVEAEDYVPFTWRYPEVEVERDFAPRIPLAAVGAIEGIVTDEEGNPVSGALLHGDSDDHWPGLLTAEEREALDLPGRAHHDEPPDCHAYSDAEGRFRLPVLPGPSPQHVSAIDSVGRRADSESVVVESSASRPWVEIVLPDGATVRGRVLCNGEPWLGDIFWKRAGSRSSGRIHTDREGAYELAHVPAGEISFFVRNPGHRNYGNEAKATLVVEAGKTYEKDILWEQEISTITGRVTSASGEPLANVHMGAYCRSEGERFAYFWGSTGEDGTYGIEVFPSDSYEVTARRAPTEDSRQNVAAGSTNVDFVLPDLGRLTLRFVEAATGEPAQVEYGSRRLGWRMSGDATFHRTDVHLSGDGTAELELPVGTVDLSVYLNDCGYAPTTVRGLAVTTDPSPRPVVIELQPGVEVKLALTPDFDPPAGSLADHELLLLEESQLPTVRDSFPRSDTSSSDRLEDLPPWQGEPGLVRQMCRPDDRGRAHLRGLAPGRYAIHALPDDLVFEPESFEITGDEEGPVEIRWRLR